MREFRRLWIAHALSVIGDQLARVAITILVFQRTESAGLTALTYALTYIPDLIGGATLAGLADRFPRRTVMVVTDLARAGLLILMAIPGVHLAVQCGLLVLIQLLSAPFSSARQAVLADMLSGDRLTVGIGAISMTYQVGLVIGFGSGAALVAEVGVSAALLIDAATFMLSAAVIQFGLPRYSSAPQIGRTDIGQWQIVKAGWAIVAKNAQMRTLLAIACCAGFYVVPEGLAAPYAAQIGADTVAVGLLLIANPAGTVIGLTLLQRIPPDRRLQLIAPLAIASSAILLPTGLAPGLIVTLVLWTASGMFSAHDMITQATYLRLAPAHHRGQAMGVAIAGLRMAQGLGIIVAGLLAQLLSPAIVIAIAALLGSAVTVMVALRWNRTAPPHTVFPPTGEADDISH
ncbi:MFS transporter [Phytoactinopolyspora halotolerans]|uniref:MFS transporter n=1 Tax=Phytoactinopolyspora halotolerans TaxID=1981512 RepID=UPI001C203E9A|nr:MFS transporter [Phytoactinopolyspora halotolerans]